MTIPAANPPAFDKIDLGRLGEDLVARWLTSQDWIVLHRRWHCRRGELDLVAQCQSPHPGSHQASLLFVEVKTRGPRNWDADGLLAIAPSKQKKLWQTAQHFLSDYPELAELPCRFDVALVSHRWFNQTPLARSQSGLYQRFYRLTEILANQASESSPPVPKAQQQGGYGLTLRDYIPAAFE